MSAEVVSLHQQSTQTTGDYLRQLALLADSDDPEMGIAGAVVITLTPEGNLGLMSLGALEGPLAIAYLELAKAQLIREVISPPELIALAQK